MGNNGDDGLVGGLGNDRLDGGLGEFNVAVYVEAPGAIAVDLTSGAASGASGADTLVNITAVLGSRRGDTIKGGPRSDVLIGAISGRGGDDLLAGMGGDRVSGGGGLDLVDFSAATKQVSVSLNRGEAVGEGRDRLREIEGVIGGPRGDKRDRRANLIVGGPGDDD